MSPAVVDPLFFETPAAFRRWLAKHHDRAIELWVVFHKKGSGLPSLTWPESVDQALCFGWIDGVRKSLDETRYVQRFTPRRPTSNRSKINVAKRRRGASSESSRFVSRASGSAVKKRKKPGSG